MSKLLYYVGVIALVASVFATRPAKGEETKFVVTNKCTTSFTVVNKCVADTPVIPQPKVVVRQAVGHTHTCANGHTWDHSVTTSHNCPTCGLYQNIQDPFPRAVTTGQQLPVPASPSFASGSVSSGCANGSCGVSSSPRFAPSNSGWYPGKVLGR